MIVVFLGPPGAGKGTQCKLLAEKYQLEHLSSGDILRRERSQKTDLGAQAESYMDSGQLVPDELIVAMMIGEIQKPENNAGVVLDGFPRTIGQAQALDQALQEAGKQIDVVLNLIVDDDKLELRVTGRRSCPACGAAYHTAFNPPKTANRCDKGCGELTQRPDDTPETVANRIKQYHGQTAPLVEYYQQQNLQNIDGNVGIEQVTEALCAVMDAVQAGV